jgi:endonuclease YncB( thermonuclease family)
MRLMFFLSLLCSFFTPVFAQETRQVLLRNIDVESSVSVSGVASNARETTITLWGIEPLETNNTIAGRIALEAIINNSPLNCTIKQWNSDNNGQAQCIGLDEQDIALRLIEKGYATADRRAIRETIFDSIYRNAELAARNSRAGLWRMILPEPSEYDQLRNLKDNQFSLTNDTAYLLIAATILGPFIGMLIVGGIIYTGFKRLLYLQRYQIAAAEKKDRAMREREKFIVAASLEGEMNTNRAKLDAFIIIYEELLKNLRDPLKDHKYKKGGDIIHEKPALLRNVYDSNIDKLDVLGPQIVTDLTALYTTIEPNPDYKTIEPSTPIDDVIQFVETIIADAEAMLQPIDKISASLNVIVRDKRAKGKNA